MKINTQMELMMQNIGNKVDKISAILEKDQSS
jgi:hypothetical protein